MIRISPSLASANQLQLLAEIQRAESASARTLHVDIEDGNYVPNITFGLRTVEQIREVSHLPCSYHLMVERPLELLRELPMREGDMVFIHEDNHRYPSELLNTILGRGVKAGLAFNPSRLLAPFTYLFPQCTALLILTAEPDGRGQRYLPAMENKITKAREMGVPEIWVDGGVSLDIFPVLEACGVTDAVLGRAFFQG